VQTSQRTLSDQTGAWLCRSEEKEEDNVDIVVEGTKRERGRIRNRRSDSSCALSRVMFGVEGNA
jgi:hypothetical protein